MTPGPEDRLSDDWDSDGAHNEQSQGSSGDAALDAVNDRGGLFQYREPSESANGIYASGILLIGLWLVSHK